MTLTELVKVLPNALNEIVKVQNELVGLIGKNDERIMVPLCGLLSEIFKLYQNHEALVPLADAIYAQVSTILFLTWLNTCLLGGIIVYLIVWSQAR